MPEVTNRENHPSTIAAGWWTIDESFPGRKLTPDFQMSRIEQIRAMLADEPQDTFLRYALAMELGNQDESENALSIYDELMRDDPPYVPAFFMAGQLLTRIDDLDRARTVLQEGIEHARGQNNMHAAGEMTEFLASLDDLEN